MAVEMRDSLTALFGQLPYLLRDDADKEVVITQIMAELHAEHSRGLDDAADVCEKVAESAGKERDKWVASVLALQLRRLRALNDRGHEATIHNWFAAPEQNASRPARDATASSTVSGVS